MQARWHWIVLLFLSMGLPLLACSLTTNEVPSPTVAPTAEEPPVVEQESSDSNSATGVPEPEEPEEEGVHDGPGLPELSALEDKLARYNSYRIQIRVTFEDNATSDNGGGSGSLVMERVRTINPPASRLTLKSGGALSQELDQTATKGELSFVKVGGETYSVVREAGCLAGRDDAMAVTEGFAEVLDSLLGSVQQTVLIGAETVNGQMVDHYHFDQDDIVSTTASPRDVSGDLYVSQEGGYPVRIVYEGVGHIDLFGSGTVQDGRLRLEYDILDVGAPLQIELPAECQGATTAFPVMKDARELISMADFVTYRVDSSLEEVVAFYQREMEALGYMASDEQVIFEDTAILQFAAEGRPNASVAITAEVGEVLVLITTEESK